MTRRRPTRPGRGRGLAASVAGVALLGAIVAPVTALAVDNGAPTPTTDSIALNEDEGPATGNVLANDTDPDGDTLVVTQLWPLAAGQGTLTVGASGAYSYTPPQDWSGAASTWYYVGDGNGHIRIGYINISVTAVNDAPVAAAHAISTGEDTPVGQTAAELKSGATDVEGDPLAVTSVSNATHGAAAWDGAVATFTPAPDFCGAAGYDYALEDSAHAAATAHVTVTVGCANDAPVAAAHAASGSEDHDLVLAAAALVAGSSDPDGDALAVAAVRNATHGAATLQSGGVKFSPAANYCGAASFEYRLTDGALASGWAGVTLTVGCVNDAPVANPDAATVAEDSGPASYDVTADDTDADGDPLTVTQVAVAPGAGTATIVSNRVRFAPATGFTGDAVITYTVSDGSATDTGTLTVTVEAEALAPVVDVPTVAFGTGRVNESAPLVIGWHATDAAGVKGYEVQVRLGAGAWTTIYTGTGLSLTASYPFATQLRWQVRATDNNDNVSGWVQSATRTLVAYQGGSPVTRTGTWTAVTSSGSSGTGYRYATTQGKKVQLTFTGVGVLYVAPRLRSGGYAKVTIAGVTSRVRLKADTTRLGRIVKSQVWSTSASRTIKVVNDQGGRRTTFDAFIVLQ